MSLINDMLRDLDNRRKHEPQGKTFSEVPIAVKGKNTSQIRWWLPGAVLLCLGVVGGLAVWLFPLASQHNPEKMVAVQGKQQLEAENAQPSAKVNSAPQLPIEEQARAIQLIPENPEAVLKDGEQVAKLLGVEVTETVESATLLLNFSELPEYRLEKDGQSATQSKLVISLGEVQLDDTVEIPELTGKLLERISLLPQQKQLQLLVDMGPQSEVGNYELKGDREAGYILQIVINQTAPLIVSTPKNTLAQEEVAAESATTVAPKATQQGGVVSTNSVQMADTSHLNRSKSRISQDKQAYQSGLEQMRQGKFAAAEKNFATALEINPAHVQARMQLIASLQRQNKGAQAQAQMKEGLSQTPRSLQLRKIYARFLLSRQHNLEAIEVLRAQPFPTVGQDPEYHALLAAILQETGQFSAAAKVYANLLLLRPETALWWFGLAVSMDQTGDFEQARNAYRRALALPGLSVDVQKYVQSRLQVL